ncbi:hypothetical protein SBA1_420011 [Candidatus Sulfotelmatobacter kueseliae]|uniref:Uncharacterized protein n=1 Tax=Candidatus Sulfotelmatobacter kueseliae TaxID=2042962 RepID=A0A2U3KR22_9BACT|nr:hypothetical protein SBA1_420011 [Candidatus Sulfotelmatobacter kueseliae]
MVPVGCHPEQAFYLQRGISATRIEGCVGRVEERPLGPRRSLHLGGLQPQWSSFVPPPSFFPSCSDATF